MELPANEYSPWLHKIPRLLKLLAATDFDWLDRRAIEKLFSLRKTTAVALLNRMGAQYAGSSLQIRASELAKRLRQIQRDPTIRWEVQRRGAVAEKIRSLQEQVTRTSMVRAEPPPDLRIEGLPATIEVSRDQLTIRYRSFEDLMQQLVLLAQASDVDTEALRDRIEGR